MPFQSGDKWKGNKEGRPVGTKNFTTKVREALDKIVEGKDYKYEEAFIKSILKKAIVDGDVQMIKIMWNYFDGLPNQKIDITSKGKSISHLSEKTDDELRNIAETS